jgi:hypothetical protein
MMSVATALRLIPARAHHLDRIDDKISHVIHYVEKVLTLLNVRARCEVRYDTPDGRFILTFDKVGQQWVILHGAESDDHPGLDIPLDSAPRHVRAEVFTVYEGHEQSPIEELIVAAARSLDTYAKDRTPQLDRALSLASVLTAAGFPDDGGQ